MDTYYNLANDDQTKDSAEQDEPKSDNQKYRLSTKLFIGGGEVRQDIQEFSKDGGNIIVATPGRLFQLLQARPLLFHTKLLEVLVMDEADRLLDLGFEKQVKGFFKFVSLILNLS